MPILSMVLFTRALGLEFGNWIYQSVNYGFNIYEYEFIWKLIIFVWPVLFMYDYMMFSFNNNFENSQDILLDQNFVTFE